MIQSILVCCTIINVLFVQGESFVLSNSQRSPATTTNPSSTPESPAERLHRHHRRNLFRLTQRDASNNSEASTNSDEDDDHDNITKISDKKKNQIEVSSEIELPFSAEIAFDAFSNLPRQASWSPWLKSVEYINNDTNETKWTMQPVLGISYSWKAKSTRLERPHVIEWESTKGLKNWGRVTFIPHSNNDVEDASGSSNSSSCTGTTTMQLTLTFVAPRIVARFFRKRQGGLSRMVQTRIVGKTLRNFRRVVLAEDVVPTKDVPSVEEEEESETHATNILAAKQKSEERELEMIHGE